jgi:hypothetical protein
MCIAGWYKEHNYLIYKDECLYVCLYLIQINISEPIGTKLCTHLLRGLEETVGHVWAHNISPFLPFRPILSGAGAGSCAVAGCWYHTTPLLRYIRDAARAGVTSRMVGCAMKMRRSERNACVKMETRWDGKEVTNELHLQLHCIYTNDNVKPI